MMGGIGRVPLLPQKSSGPAVEEQRELHAAVAELDASMSGRGGGSPRAMVRGSTSANYGDLVPVDPTLATADSVGVHVYINLPKGDTSHVGEIIAVKNYSSSTNEIRLQPVKPDVIDGAPYKDMATAWQMVTLKLIEQDKWIAVAQNGCVDCTTSCSATCTGSCAAACGGSCSGGCTGDCATGCVGSCSAACASDCSTGCTGSCASSATGSCMACAGACSNACQGSCAGDCGGSCGGTCDASCAGSAQGSCSGECTGSCAGGCGGSCSGSCDGLCTGDCVGSCAGQCSSTCSAGCSVSATG